MVVGSKNGTAAVAEATVSLPIAALCSAGWMRPLSSFLILDETRKAVTTVSRDLIVWVWFGFHSLSLGKKF